MCNTFAGKLHAAFSSRHTQMFKSDTYYVANTACATCKCQTVLSPVNSALRATPPFAVGVKKDSSRSFRLEFCRIQLDIHVYTCVIFCLTHVCFEEHVTRWFHMQILRLSLHACPDHVVDITSSPVDICAYEKTCLRKLSTVLLTQLVHTC